MLNGKIAAWLLAGGLTLLLGGCATYPPRPPAPSIEDIVQMSQDGLTPAEIIDRIDESGGLYALKASELAELRDRGVADEVIDHMQQVLIDAERAREAMRERDRLWMYGYPMYPRYPWGDYWRPHYRR
jgi:hypothetical protein